ncbi:MAG: dihydropteroate synthase [Muribaculaceae bacterium]|nr:dihydropteroate synthase [Muribaculaceae bacterium]
MTPFSINIKGRLVEFTEPVVMGILNVTPDSFHAASRIAGEDELISIAKQMLDDGADIIDVGGCSTRPGADYASESEELNRVINAITALRREFPEAIISVDTFRARVAREAVAAGADIINDISGMSLDEEMFNAVCQLNVPYILTDCNELCSVDVDATAACVIKNIQQNLRRLVLAGVNDIIVDPGFGFGKTIEQNYALMANLDLFSCLNRPVLVGISRKSMITKLLEIDQDEALEATTALNIHALRSGASILRVHDVKAAKQTIKINSKLESINKLGRTMTILTNDN